MTSHIDLIENLKVPHVNVSGALALARELLVRVPPDSRASVRSAAKRVRDAAVDLHHAWRRTTPAALRTDPRPIDQELDATWIAIHERLHAYTEIETPNSSRASELLALLFADGLAFLDTPYAQQWAESRKRLDEVRERGLRDEMITLCGSEFVHALEAAQERYGIALGMANERSVPPPATLSFLRSLRAAIAHYSIQVIACIDPDDPASVDAAEAMLKPILVRRNQAWIVQPDDESDAEAEEPELPYVDLSDLLD